MPESLKLHEFGSMLWDAFGTPAYHVGSSLSQKSGWRDVDVRLILDDRKYKILFGDDPANPQMNPRWRAVVRAFTLLGREVTGLPIDFQIQQTSWANKHEDHDRSMLGLVPHRFNKEQ